MNVDERRQSLGPGILARDWWRKWILDDPANRGVRRAVRARLRRASMPMEVVQEPEALRLLAKLPDKHRNQAAILAGILAFVEVDADEPVAWTVGQRKFDPVDQPKMSEARFRRLLQSAPHELMDPMRRLVRLADGKVNVFDLSKGVFFWDDDETRKHWIYNYYGVSIAKPAANQKEPSS